MMELDFLAGQALQQTRSMHLAVDGVREPALRRALQHELSSLEQTLRQIDDVAGDARRAARADESGN